MTTRDEVAWLARRAGWGLRPGELDALTELGTEAVIDMLVAPDDHGIGPEASPWDGVEYVDDPQQRPGQVLDTIERWVTHLVTTERPFENSLSWFWHDHFAVSYAVVQHLPAMIDHLELLRRHALGDFRQLIREVSTDAAMLIFLDGATSTGEAPNENYGRELLELYTTGVGNYTEDDVQAAAVALTGYVVQRRRGFTVAFVPPRHDDTPQTFLGVNGVNDVDGVVDAAVSHPATPGFIAGKVARHYLGSVDHGLIDRFATTFADHDLTIAPLGRAVLEAGLDGAGGPLVMAPVPWTVQILRATGATPPPRPLIDLLGLMGQVPGNPPSVGGFPGATTWLASSATAGRFTAAGGIARMTPDDGAAPVACAALAAVEAEVHRRGRWCGGGRRGRCRGVGHTAARQRRPVAHLVVHHHHHAAGGHHHHDGRRRRRPGALRRPGAGRS